MEDEPHPTSPTSPTPPTSPLSPRSPTSPTVPANAAGPSNEVRRPRSARSLVPIVATSVVSSLLASLATVAIVAGSLSGLAATPSPTASATSAPVAASSVAPASGGTNPEVAVAAKVRSAVVTISSTTGNQIGLFGVPTGGIGSGFIIDSNGLILTNAHVVEGATSLTVALEDGRELDARVVASDTDLDLAVVKVAATGLPTVEIGSSADLQVGQLVVAIGSPLGAFTDSVTSGILSATGRTITVTDAVSRQRKTIDHLLQTDAAINEGNSGGPLLDANGRVIGINTAEASSANGIGFAIPIDEAAAIIASATA
jgi:serine protease Do